MSEPITITQAVLPTINTSNLYVDVDKKGAGTLTGKDVDAKLVAGKAERLLKFKESMTRNINTASESTLFSAGQINATPVELSILRTQISKYVEKAFIDGTLVKNITVFRSDLINGKLTVTEQIDFNDCYIITSATDVVTADGDNLQILNFSFRFNERKGTLFFFDQTGKAKGQDVSLINFSKGTLHAQGGKK